MRKVSTKKITSIGGSALIEGIMMRGPKRTTVCVRTGENEIYSEDIKMTTIPEKCKLFKLPLLRGIAGLIDSMRLSYKSLMLSADKAVEAGEVEEEEPSKFEKWFEGKFGSEKLEKAVVTLSMVLGVGFSVVLFFLLPTLIGGFFDRWIGNAVVRSLIEGVVRVIIFLGYMIGVSQMKDMKRVFSYHGAEHKTIRCYEAQLPLTVENCRGMTRLHPRCGTSFLFVVVAISILLFALVSAVFPTSNMLVRMLIRLALLPFVVSISYECNRFVGRHDNALTRALSAPGMWFQHFTTNEPDDSMLEVAIEALKLVIPDEAGADRW